MISDKMEKALNDQIKAEFDSAYLYLAMSAQFESETWRGFAVWMRKQYEEEIKHGMKIYDFIVDRGGRVALKQLDEPKREWKSPLDAFQDAYNHEVEVTRRIHNLVNLAESEKDQAAFQFLQWFVEEQVEEEQQTDQAVQLLKKVGDATPGLLILDHQFGERKD
jgi:ferritin